MNWKLVTSLLALTLVGQVSCGNFWPSRDHQYEDSDYSDSSGSSDEFAESDVIEETEDTLWNKLYNPNEPLLNIRQTHIYLRQLIRLDALKGDDSQDPGSMRELYWKIYRLSDVNKNKCKTLYLPEVDRLLQKLAYYSGSNLLRYIMHFFLKQINLCRDTLAENLKLSLDQLGPERQSGAGKLRKSVLDAGCFPRQLESLETLIMSDFEEGTAEYLRTSISANALRLTPTLTEIFEYQMDRAQDMCKHVVDTLKPQHDTWKRLSETERQNFGSDTSDWMLNVKVCEILILYDTFRMRLKDKFFSMTKPRRVKSF